MGFAEELVDELGFGEVEAGCGDPLFGVADGTAAVVADGGLGGAGAFVLAESFGEDAPAPADLAGVE